MGPEPTRILFDSTRIDFLTQRGKIEKFGIIGEIFQTETQTKDG